MEIKEILAKLGKTEDDLLVGESIRETGCIECGGSFGYLFIPKGKQISSRNVVVKEGFKEVRNGDKIQCQLCGKEHCSAASLFNKKIYEKE